MNPNAGMSAARGQNVCYLPAAKNEKRHSFGVPFSVNPDEIILLKSA
jgi:hypothetical protein